MGAVAGSSRPSWTVFISRDWCTQARAPLLRDDLQDEKEESQEKTADRTGAAVT